MNLLAEITEGTRISTEAIRANPLRSVLTTLGNRPSHAHGHGEGGAQRREVRA